MVVCIHIPFPGSVGNYITALSRIAVPIFFMITGYFYSDVVKKGRTAGQIKKLFILMVEANLIYFVWKWLYTAVLSDVSFLSSTFTVKNMLKFLFLNDSPLSGHLWYLGAILYSLIIVFIANNLKLGKILYWLTPVLLLMDLVFGKYSLVLFNREFPYILVRNFLFVGIPYFCIGRMIREGLGQKIKKNTAALLIFIFSMTTCIERFILVSTDMNPTRDHYISTTFLAIVVFLFILKCDSGKEHVNLDKLQAREDWLTDLLAIIGWKYSTWLYILHPIFITCIGTVMSKIGLQGVYKYMGPVVIYVVTIVFLLIVDRVKKTVLRRS